MKVTFADDSTEEYQDTYKEDEEEGGEGLIYRSREKGVETVVKLYLYGPKLPSPLERRSRIEKLIDSSDFNPTKDNPYWADFFAWPEKLVREPRIGFRMRLAKDLKTLNNYIGNKYAKLPSQERGWLVGRIAAAIKLVTAANKLESMGLCYPDFSPKNIMVNPFTGQMVLVDCDSVAARNSLPTGIIGTPRYCAPEILMGTARHPFPPADLHALAVILYSWLLLRHPLEGDKVFNTSDRKEVNRLRYGQQALYIEDPHDLSNRTAYQVLKAYMLGSELEELFDAAFVDGLHQPDNRPHAHRWLEALYHTYDRLIPCPSPYCDWRFFVVEDRLQLQCPRCKEWVRSPRTIPFVYILHPGSHNDYNDPATKPDVVGWSGRYLHQWHAQPDDKMYRDPLYIPDTKPCAVFAYDEKTRQWSLKNLTLPHMSYQYPGDNADTWRTCPLMSSVPLSTETMIQFGKTRTHARAAIVLERVR